MDPVSNLFSSPMARFHRRVSFDCYDPDQIPPQKTDQSVQIIPNTPFQPNHRRLSPPSPVIKAVPNDNSIDQPLHAQTRRAYHQMSDQELLEMDLQFQMPRAPNLDSYRNTGGDRLQNAPLASGDQTSLTTFKSVKRNTYKLTGYPTKPLITRNSMSLMFTHPQFNNHSLGGKCYLLLLSNNVTSVCALDYYKKSLAKPGDTIVIAFSLSSVSIGDKASPELRAVLKDLTNYVLGYLPIEQPIKIVFEVFKTGSFLSDLMALYVPSLVIVGTHRKFSRSTSFAFGQRKFVPLVYAGLEEICRDGGQSSVCSNSDTVTFKDSFKSNSTSVPKNDADVDPKSTTGTGIQIKVDETPNASYFSNETIKLFANLNPAPNPKPTAKNMDRRGSMHSVSSSVSSTTGVFSSSAIDSDEETDESPHSQFLSKKSSSSSGSVLLASTTCPQKNTATNANGDQMRRWKSAGSGSSAGILSKEERDRLALFEKHQKAISGVNTGKSKSFSSQSSAPAKNLDTPAADTATPSSGSTGGFFKRLLGKK